LAGFQVIIDGRFWVFTKAHATRGHVRGDAKKGAAASAQSEGERGVEAERVADC
jgi:hypothetical protein